MKPALGESSQGALVGAVVGAIGGLFAVGVPHAIIERSFRVLFNTPILGLICWFAGGLVGWLIGGQTGPRLAIRLQSQRAELAGGVIGGLIPVILIALWGWYLVTH